MSDAETKLFDDVRALQASRHASGSSVYDAFTRGRCHALAYALQDEMGGDLVVITPRHDPAFLVHAAVHKDGMVTDGSGHTPSGVWGKIWEHQYADDNLSYRRASRAEIDHMMAHRPATADEVDQARPYAAALIAARDIHPAAWRSQLPFGANNLIMKERALGTEEALAEAKARRPLPEIAPIAFAPSAVPEKAVKVVATKVEVDEARAALASGLSAKSPVAITLSKLANAIAQPQWAPRAGGMRPTGEVLSGKPALDALGAGFGKGPHRIVTLDAVKAHYGVHTPIGGIGRTYEQALTISQTRDAAFQRRRRQKSKDGPSTSR